MTEVITPRLVWSKNLQRWRCQGGGCIGYGKSFDDAYLSWRWKMWRIPPGEV